MRVYFTITLNGRGKDIDECWNDAVGSFYEEPGATPEEGEYELAEDDEDDWEEDEEEENDDEESPPGGWISLPAND